MFLLPSMTINLLWVIFNLESGKTILENYLDCNNLTNLIKPNTCFKGKGSSIDLILTNRKFSFKNSSSYEARLNDHII